MHSIRAYIRAYRQRQHVRPYALLAPILILLLALPLLRPLRHPAVTAEEAATLTAVQSMVERGIAAAATGDPRVERPVFVFLLAGPYWLMHQAGLKFGHNPTLVAYLLTVVGVTLPAAFSAGLVYRMGRLFELRRPRRTALALACVFATGLFSYATVLNPQVPASFAILWSCACLIHVAVVGHPSKSGFWLALAGLLASAAAVIEPASSPFLLLLPLVICAMRWPWSLRVAGVMVYAFGALPPLALHLALIGPDPIRGAEAAIRDSREFVLSAPTVLTTPVPDPFDDLEDPQTPLERFTGQFARALLGSHGLLTHFPVVLVAFFGIGAVMHRHWPTSTKVLGAVTGAASVLIVVATAVSLPHPAHSTFASRWFILFTPALLFWCGAWLRRPHRTGSWVTVSVLLGFSTIVSMIGSLNPLPPAGYRSYTPYAAIRSLTRGAAQSSAAEPGRVAVVERGY